MEYTSLIHLESHDYPRSFNGTPEECITRFEDYCMNTNVLWGYLFNFDMGSTVAFFSPSTGLQRFGGKST